MKNTLDKIEETFLKDPVVFSWSNMKRRTNMSEEDLIFHLVRALINSKNLALRVIEKNKEDKKVIRLRP